MTQPPHASDTEPYAIPSGDPPRTDQVIDPNPATVTDAVPDATAPAGAATPDPGVVSYSPTPEHRPEWARPDWLEPAPPPPYGAATGGAQPGSAAGGIPPAVPTQPVAIERRSGGPGFGQLLGAALLSAVLASGGTLLVLQGTGALHPAGSAAQPSAGVSASRVPTAVDDSSAVVNAAASVSPAVVRIIVEGVSTDVFGGQIPETGVGSGIIYDAAGWILTNKHVVTNQDGSTATRMTVELKDGRQFDGTVYGIDTLTDLAIVKVDATGLPTAAIGRSADIKVGQLAIAIGSPLGTYTSTVTTGIISATGRTVQVSAEDRLSNLIQTDAAINPGNSGGPLLDAAGTVIGINTAMEKDSTGIGFAIPVDIARPIMQQAIAGEKLARPYLGVRYVAVDARLKAEEKLTVDHGALIGGPTNDTGTTAPAVTPSSPAEAAGLKDGDIILAIEGQAIDSEHPLDAVLTSFAPGQTVKLTILRGTGQLDISVTLGTRPKGL
jgi:S1-C subfamily serine protease